MSSKQRGIGTSGVEVTGISAHGVWLLIGKEEVFLSYEDFPWFKDTSVGKILNVTPGHFYWPDWMSLGLEYRHPIDFRSEQGGRSQANLFDHYESRDNARNRWLEKSSTAIGDTSRTVVMTVILRNLS